MATILVVEEGPIHRHHAVTLLRDHGHRVLEASKGEEALALLRDEKPDLMLIDLLMSNTDVPQFIMNIRQDPELVQPRILVCANVHIEDEARALAAAIRVPFVPKPVNPTVLLATIDAVLADPPLRPTAPPVEQRAVDLLLRPVLRKLSRYTANLETLNVQMDRYVVECNTQIEAVRSAMDQEVRKRLWAEHELTQANLSLRDQAIRDPLTGLYNRRYLEESLGREEARARRRGEPLGLMLIDVDEFKTHNDTHGHAAGDAVLRAVGQFMAGAARGEDIVSRYGGDEFVLVMSRPTPNVALERAERLRYDVRELRIEFEGRRIGPVTLSIGVAVFPDHGPTCQAVLQVADAALYQAKQSGRNCVVMGNTARAAGWQ